MSKTKTAKSEKPVGNQEAVSSIQSPASKQSTTGVRIIYQGTCPKLTARGRGDLSYELGSNDGTKESYVRITVNASSGAFSNEWLALGQIRALLDLKSEQKKTFSAVTMEGLFARRSANNYGYLAAVLIAEGVIETLPGKPVMLSLGDWDPLFQKINSLKEEGVSLTDHIAITAQKKAEQKAERMANLRSANSTKPTNSTAAQRNSNIQGESSEDIQEPLA